MRYISLYLACSLLTELNCSAQGQRIIPSEKTTLIQTELLTQPVVKRAIDALQAGDAKAWFALFTEDAALFDDGNKMNFHHFFEKAIGHERFTHIDKTEQDGLQVYGRFHSDQWGDFKTYFKFRINAAGKIDRLEMGQASY